MSSYFGLIEEIMDPSHIFFSCKLCVKRSKVKVLCIRMRVQKLIQPILWSPNMRIFFSPSFLTQFHLVLFNFSRLVHRVIYIK